MVKNSQIEATFEFVRTTSGGEEEVFLRVKLSTARVAGIRQYQGFAVAGHDSASEPRLLEDVRLGIHNYEVTYVPTGSTYQDSWPAPQ